MIIAQITDLHVVAKNRLCYPKVPTNAQLAQSIAHINSLDPRPDAVIASGDLTDHGRPEEYDLLREILSDLIPPVFVIPGNHDRRDVLLKAFASEDYMPPPDAPFVNYAIDKYPVRLIGLDTSVLEHHHGMRSDSRRPLPREPCLGPLRQQTSRENLGALVVKKILVPLRVDLCVANW